MARWGYLFPHDLTSYLNVCIIGGVRGGIYIQEKKMKRENKTPNGKKCIWCMEIKNISEFDKYEKSSDGYRSMCYSCMKIKKGNKSGKI